MKSLITSEHSYIGNHLQRKLEARGDSVKRLSMRNSPQWQADLAAFEPDNVFHLAAYGSQSGEGDLDETVRFNLIESINLMEVSFHAKVKNIVLTGSSSEYGKYDQPMSEDYAPHPNTLYAATKAAMTILGSTLSKMTNTPVITARPFSVYGPEERDYRFIPTVIRSCLTNEPLRLVPDQNHDWIYVDDFVGGLIFCSNNAKSLKGEVINFGTGRQTTNKKIVEMTEELTGKRANVTETLPRREHESEMWVADIKKATTLGWKAKTSLPRGLARTISYYEDKYRAS